MHFLCSDFTREMLGQLRGQRQREVVRARLDGLSVAETAKLLGCTPGAVRLAISMARQRLGLPDGRTGKPRAAGRPRGFAKQVEILLPPRHRPAARLAGLGRSLPQIASELGISMRAAEVRLSRARAALRQRLCVEGGALNYTSSGTSALGEVG